MDTFLTNYNGFDFLSIEPNSEWWDTIIEFGYKCDKEFVPALSARMPIEEYFGRFRTEKGFTVLACRDNDFVGCLCNFYVHPETNKPWYQCIIINEKYRQNKLAQKFYDLSDEILRDKSEFFVQGRTWVENIRNRKALKSIGFYQIDALVNDRGDGIHTLLYEKSLYNSKRFQGIKKLGILGGMGSNASAKFLSDLCFLTSQTDKEQYQLPILLNSATYIPDRTELLLENRNEELAKILEHEVSTLLQNGTSHVIICCFSFHAVLRDLSISLQEKVVSLTDYTIDLLNKKQCKYLLLATKGTYKLKNFKDADTLLYPNSDDQEKIHECIYRIKRGEPSELVFLDIEKLIEAYACKGLVLGCTDLFLVADQIESHFKNLDVINTLKVMKYDIVDTWKQNLTYEA